MTSAPNYAAPPEVPPVVVAAWQTVARSNGGLESLTSLFEACDFRPSLVVTNRWSAFAERWARVAPVELRPMMSGAERGRSRITALPQDLRSLLRNNAWMARRLASIGDAILHCNDEVALLNFGIGARLAGRPVLFHVRDTRPERNLYRVLRWRLFFSLSNIVITLSREMSAWWLRYLEIAGMPPVSASKLRYLYSVVSPTSATQASFNPRRRPNISLVVGVVGVFCPKKAQLELIERCCRPLAQCNIEFRFFGDMEAYPEYAAKCRTIASDMLDHSIYFMGHVDNANDMYRDLDLVVVASRHEGLARAMIEALAAGVPVLSFEVCSAREILVEHGAGIVVPNGDYPALVCILRQLAADRSALDAMSANARSIAERHFAPRTLAAEYRHLLVELNYVAHLGTGNHEYFRRSAHDVGVRRLRVRDRL